MSREIWAPRRRRNLETAKDVGVLVAVLGIVGAGAWAFMNLIYR